MSHVSTLRDAGLAYFATPYTRFPDGIEAAYREACMVAGELFKAGVFFISPIAHGHGIAKHGGVSALDHKAWLTFDEGLMSACHFLLVAEMHSWHLSYGIHQEIAWFTQNNKPVYYLDPERLLVSETPLACALPMPKEVA